MISPESKMKSSDRVLILEPMEGKKVLDTSGRTDPRLFKEGEDSNKLHAIMNPDSCLWSFKYDKGAIPMALQGTFTGFRALYKFADNYYAQRNVKITEVKD